MLIITTDKYFKNINLVVCVGKIKLYISVITNVKY